MGGQYAVEFGSLLRLLGLESWQKKRGYDMMRAFQCIYWRDVDIDVAVRDCIIL